MTSTPRDNTPCLSAHRDRRIPTDCAHVSLEVQDRARRFVRTGGFLFPRFGEPWHAWPLADQVALERSAHAALCRTLPAATADLIRRGRCRQLILLKMRHLHGLSQHRLPSDEVLFDRAMYLEIVPW